MATMIDLKKGELSRHVTKALKALSDGYFIALPAEHGYVFVVDAFNRDGVRAMQVLRGAEDGVTAQVAIKNIKTAQGICRELSPMAIKLAEKNWPGLLTLVVKPNRQLAWDLGDNGYLDEIAIRSPKAKFFKAILGKSGPLAFVSVAASGQAPILDPKLISKSGDEPAIIFSNGKLRKGPQSTVVRAIGGQIELMRQGAVNI